MKQQLFSMLFSKKPTLGFCILMDVIGMASFIFPAMGEWSDLVWAPLSAYIFYQAFGSIGGMIGGGVEFLEEIIPFTDIIPTFTIAWYLQNKFVNTSGNASSNKNNTSTTNDVEDAEIIEVS